MTESGLRSFLPGFSIYKFVLSGNWKKGDWHPASTLSGKSKCQWAHIGNVQILEQKPQFRSGTLRRSSQQTIRRGPPRETAAWKKGACLSAWKQDLSWSEVCIVLNDEKMECHSFGSHSVHFQFHGHAHCQIMIQAPSYFWAKSSFMWATSFRCVLAPPADSGQCRFSVIIWIEQSS